MGNSLLFFAAYLCISSYLIHDTFGDGYHHRDMISKWCNNTKKYPLTQTEMNYLNQKSEFQQRSVQGKCIRKEYRTLTTEERQRFHTTIIKMKTSVIDPEMGTNRYDVFTMQHRSTSAPGAHGGPAFLVYHRMLLYRFEQALREIDDRVCLPYWDSTLDSHLPNAGHSVVWSSGYLGNNYGIVGDGPCGGWKIVPEECEQVNSRLYREMLGDPGLMMTEAKISQFMNKKSFADAVAPTSTYFEDSHGDIHIAINGHMDDLMCSPNDLIFYMHHCFIDLLFENFRDLHPVAKSPYPFHDIEYNRPMDPLYPWYDYNIREVYNSENFTKLYYSYQQRPKYCQKDSHCCPPYGGLYCDLNVGICKSKVRKGGECSGLGDPCCYCEGVGIAGACISGFCQCVKGCTQDTECKSDQWCDRSRWSCTPKAVLTQKCSTSDLPNSACKGSCPPSSEPMCYEYKCQCLELYYD